MIDPDQTTCRKGSARRFARRGARAAAALTLVAVAGPTAFAHADTLSTPMPGYASQLPSASPAPAPTTSSTATQPADTQPEPTPSPTPSPSPTSAPAGGVSLTVAAADSPVKGRYFQDVGRFSLRGVLTDQAAGEQVSVYWYTAARGYWTQQATVTTGAGGTYAYDQPVGGLGDITFKSAWTSSGGTVIESAPVTVTVSDATVTLDKPAAVNALKARTLTGRVYPARPGVKVSIDVVRSGPDTHVAAATTDSSGHFKASFGYGTSNLTTYKIRATYQAENRDRTETSSTRSLKRIAVLDASVARTTKADVAKTYRGGCPTGPSKLRTIDLNYYGFDGRVHRGDIIVRSDLTGKVTRAFSAALAKKYPIHHITNPNEWGGNDPKQMAADNTSGFNCRKVVGNPYAQSPHSYGIAIDINTVENPYRDNHGTWWPANGKKFIDRTPLRKGMLGHGSTFTTAMRKEGYFWGGQWNPGRDYQHFEYRR